MTSICIDCRYLGPKPSGIGKVVQALVQYLPELAPDLEFVLLRRPGPPERLSNAANVREVFVNATANSPATMWWLPKLVDLSGIDLFHATFNILPAGLTMPSVTTLHDVMWLTDPQLCNPRFSALLERAFYRHGIRRALRRSAALATVSQASGDAIVRAYPAAADRVRVTLPGVSGEFRPVAPDPEVMARLGLVPGQRYVLTVGQYAPYKNHEGALRAFAAAFGQRSDIDLVFVQRLHASPSSLARLAEEQGVTGRVRVLGRVDDEDLSMLYTGAAALLHPSFCEGFGLPLAEAMACGCPVVTSNVSAMPEVVGQAGLQADPFDPASFAAALRQVVDDPARAAAMSAAGIRRAAELDWRGFAAKNLEVYREVLGHRAPPAQTQGDRERVLETVPG